MNSRKLLILTGAGVSAESGIPTFRGENGLWKNYKVEELATPQAFEKDPETVWEWYRWRRNIIRKAKPNKSHEGIAFIEKIKKDFLLVTQNVDNLHRKAGSKKVIELHGNIFISKCIRCGEITMEENKDGSFICSCGGLKRAGVVWFGEELNSKDLDNAFSFAKKADTIIVIGTSAVVYPAAYLPYVVKRNKGKVIEINVENSAISEISDILIKEKASKVMDEIIKIIKRIKRR